MNLQSYKQFALFLTCNLILAVAAAAQSTPEGQKCTAELAAAGVCTLASSESSSPPGTSTSSPMPPVPTVTTPVIRNDINDLQDAKSRLPATVPAKAVAEPEPPTEFQEFVAASIGKQLPLFGHDLFRTTSGSFVPTDRVAVPADYIVGPGDELLVRAWGQLDISYKATVDRSGYIYIPKVGQISVAGVPFEDLAKLLRAEIGKTFRNFELTVSMGQLRTIQVLVVGQAKNPGSYSVSSLTTLVNLLFLSGGPSTNGSMRFIELRRNSKLHARFDLYDLLLKGEKSNDALLKQGDVVYIPPVKAQVAITGSVNQQAIFEIDEKTTLGALAAFAGGLSTTAEGHRVIVERISERSVRRVEEFRLDAAGLGRPVRNGDLIRVFPVNPRFENAVTLRGNVARPGRFPWVEGMRVSDLIPDRQFLITQDYWMKQNAASMKEKVEQEGLRGEIRRNASEINWSYAVIQRLNMDDLTSTLLPFDLGRAIDEPSSDSNVTLEPGDVITIFSQADLKVPVRQQSKYVRLEGEFMRAGIYKAMEGETLRSLVARLGGLTENAYLFGAQFTRESTQVEQQKKLDDLVRRYQMEIERSASNKAQNLTSPEDALAVKAKLESQRRMIEDLRQSKALGRIVLNLKPSDTDIAKLPDIVLEDGDRLVVPYKPATVGVLGAVYNTNDYLYQPGKGVDYYVRLAGGATKDADRSRVYVIKADGSIRGRIGSRGWFSGSGGERIVPGDTVVVPEDFGKVGFARSLKDVAFILSQFAFGAAAFKVLVP